jgi:CubicO group peptidase (beta-lactamase class C family)
MEIHCSNLGPDFAKAVKDVIQCHQPVAHTGVAVAVLKDGKLGFAGGYGYRDRGAQAKVNAETIFAVGSATKAFTSMAISMYVEEKKISLDVPIQQLLPDFQMKDPIASSQATLRDLLCHRSGLAPHNALWYIGPFTRSDLFYRLRYLDPVPVKEGTAFRNKFVYNNLMYGIAGHLLEMLFGVSYEDILESRIFGPLGMASTSLSLADLTSGANYAKGYEGAVELPLKNWDNIGPAAEINSNVLDMAKWMQLFLRKGLASDGSVMISQAALQQMYTPLISTGTGQAGTTYGLGWFIGPVKSDTADQQIMFHDGDADGNSAYVSFMPEAGLAVIVLSNQHCTKPLIDIWPNKVATAIYDHLLHGKVTGRLALPPRPVLPDGVAVAKSAPIPAAAAATPAASPAAAPTAAPAAPAVVPDDYTGMFSNAGYGDMVVGRSGNNLNISYYDLTWPLQPVPKPPPGIWFKFDVQAFGTVFTVYVQFFRGSTGKIESFVADLVVQPDVLWIPFVKR